MPLAGTVADAPPGAHGFDCNTALTAGKATQFRNAGFGSCARYVSRGQSEPASDLTVAEANIILDAGLALMPIQHVAREGWMPTKALGGSTGKLAAKYVDDIGIPAGVNVWLDLEGVNHAAAAEDVIDFCNAWFDQVGSAGFVPGVYVGASAILSGDQLFWRLRTKHYWRSGSTVPDIPQRGYQVTQRIVTGDIFAGVEIDRDVTNTDAFGGTVMWLTRP